MRVMTIHILMQGAALAEVKEHTVHLSQCKPDSFIWDPHAAVYVVYSMDHSVGDSARDGFGQHKVFLG